MSHTFLKPSLDLVQIFIPKCLVNTHAWADLFFCCQSGLYSDFFLHNAGREKRFKALGGTVGRGQPAQVIHFSPTDTRGHQRAKLWLRSGSEVNPVAAPPHPCATSGSVYSHLILSTTLRDSIISFSEKIDSFVEWAIHHPGEPKYLLQAKMTVYKTQETGSSHSKNKCDAPGMMLRALSVLMLTTTL